MQAYSSSQLFFSKLLKDERYAHAHATPLQPAAAQGKQRVVYAQACALSNACFRRAHFVRYRCSLP